MILVKNNSSLVRVDSQNNAVNKDIIPEGFVYVQYSGQPTPKELWPWYKWSNISSDYAGDFFRAEGGDASTFNSGRQTDNASMRASVTINTCGWGYSIDNHCHIGGTAHVWDTYTSNSNQGHYGSQYLTWGYWAVGRWEHTDWDSACSYWTTTAWFSGAQCVDYSLWGNNSDETRPVNSTVRIWKRI